MQEKNPCLIQNIRPVPAAIKTILFLTLLLVSAAIAQYPVDYRYAPGRWFTPICLIDDWQKSLVDHQGNLVYDFGPGPYAHPKTTITVEVAGADNDSTTQTLLDARNPIVLTDHHAGKYRWQQTAFALIPDKKTAPPALAEDGSFRRFQSLVGTPAWVAAQPNVDPAFRSVAWGTGRSIRYDVRVPAGRKRQMALGFLEVYRKGKISREMALQVEGAVTQTIDLLRTGAQNVPQVFFFDAEDLNQDGWLEIDIAGSPTGQDPNVFVNGIWTFLPDVSVTAADVISGAANKSAETRVNAGMELIRPGYVRMDALRTKISGGKGTLQIRVKTLRPLTVDQLSGTLLFENSPFVKTQPKFSMAIQTDEGWLLSYPDDTRAVDMLVIHGKPVTPVLFPNLAQAQQQAMRYWQQVHLPWRRLNVPDPDIQDLIDGGIRTMYQVREIVDGYPQFQPGATLYRGLWYGDGVWGAETAALLDDPTTTRNVLENMLQYQHADGRTGVMQPALLHRETAHLIFGMCRYARLHQDWTWLEQHWEQLDAAMQHMMDLRRQAAKDKDALYYNLFPPGLTDGGIAGIGSSYGSIYWGLIAMAEAARVADDMERPEADVWQAEFEDFLAAFRLAAARDQRYDEHENLFLPVLMNFDPEKHLPQRGQWGPIYALYVGQFLKSDDPLITGTMHMLNSRTEENHVLTLGWLKGGVWPIFEAHRALAYNWIGDADKVEELLYAFANHATPTLLWAEEQSPKTRGKQTAGDIPHTVANMQICRLVRYTLLLERGPDLELLGSLPLNWIHPAARLSVLALPTRFGPVTIKMQIDAGGKNGTLWIQTPTPEVAANSVKLKLTRLKKAGFTQDSAGQPLPEILELPWNSTFQLNFQR